MTDLKPGSRWLLPVTFDCDGEYLGPLFKTGLYCIDVTNAELSSLIPADRITELEAEVKEQRESVARWMFFNSYATGHGDTIDDLLMELEDQHFDRLTKLNDENERLKSELEKLK